MRRLILRLAALICVLAACSASAQSFPGVLTWHNDVGRTGQNLYETTLTPQNVNMGSFGKVFSYPVDGPLYVQPLYVPNLVIADQGMHNVIFVATENDTVYAFDADGLTTTPLWQVSFIDSSNGVTSVPETTKDSIYPSIGVTATPVIDPTTGTIYVLARTIEQGAYVQKLHALDWSTGAEKFGGPASIQATSPSNKGTLVFDPSGMQRAALLLENGIIYIGWATATHGWIMAYNATTLAQTAAVNTTPNGLLGGVWMSGAGLAADSQGYIYAATGDGLFDFNTNGVDDGDTLLKMNSSLGIVDYFTPSDQACRKTADLDLASGGPMILPPQPGPYPDLVIIGGKGGTPCDLFGSTYASPIYLLNGDSLGGYNAFVDTSLQSIAGSPEGYFSNPAYWQGPNGTYVYMSGTTNQQKGTGDLLKMYSLTNGVISSTPIAQSSNIFVDGNTPSISANGSTAGIVWSIGRQEKLPIQPPSKPAILFAYDATNVAKMLYSSAQAGTRDQAGLESKFMVPTIANGRVYIPTQSEVDVYGLFSQAAPTPVVNLSSTSLSFNNQPLGSTSSVQSVTVSNAGNGTLAISSITAGGDFSFGSTATSCPYSGGSVYAGVTCTIDVIFTPSQSGTRTGSVTVSDNAGSGQSISLNGSGSMVTDSLLLTRNDLVYSTAYQNIVLGDFNADGNQDILALSPASGSASVLTGNGDGTFNSASTTATGNNPVAAVTADFNGDGKLDAAVANSTDNTVAILLGNGDGTISGGGPFTLLTTGKAPTAIVAGDWNGDAKQDLAVVNKTDGTVSIFLGNGNGSFNLQGTVTVGNSPVAIVAADFNKDGKIDLAVANSVDGTISILPGDGTGNFSSGATVSASPNPVAIGVGDWNGDGILDLAVVNGSANSIGLFSGNGDGTFTANGTYTTGTAPQAITALDLNSDGKLDLAFTNSGDNMVSIALGNGNGTFQSSITNPTGGGPCSLVAADFDRDGQPDLASGNCGAGTISILEQEPQLTLSTSSANLGYEALGGTSQAVQVTLSNTGSAPLSLTSFTLGGDDPGDFGMSNNCGNLPVTLVPGSSCTVSITFAPTVTGARDASISIGNNSAVNPTILSVNGVGSGPSVSLSPSTLNFGNEIVGTNSGIHSAILTNTGNAPLSISSIVASASYSVTTTNTSCPYAGGSLGAGSSCTIDTIFSPTVSGTLTGAITISDNAGTPQTVTLTGVGEAQSAFVNPTTANFGTVLVGTTTTKSKTITLTNSTNAPLTVTVSFTGANPGDFTQSNSCGTPVPAWGTCTAIVRFAPVDVGSLSAKLTFTDSASNSPQTVSLSGVGTAISLSTTSLSFGNQTVGKKSSPQVVTFTNTSTTFTVAFSTRKITGTNAADFAAVKGTNQCGTTLAPGANCSFSVVFTPSATGSRSAALSISDNGGASPQTIALSGTGD